MESEEALSRIRSELCGKLIAIPGYIPVGRVVRVDKEGAWLEEGRRITTEGIVFYHPVRDTYQDQNNK